MPSKRALMKKKREWLRRQRLAGTSTRQQQQPSIRQPSTQLLSTNNNMPMPLPI
tara:strand:- start:2931 stop:3092 length:162 start_codon:yes stop_codon:yes gene_type:complete